MRSPGVAIGTGALEDGAAVVAGVAERAASSVVRASAVALGATDGSKPRVVAVSFGGAMPIAGAWCARSSRTSLKSSAAPNTSATASPARNEARPARRARRAVVHPGVVAPSGRGASADRAIVAGSSFTLWRDAGSMVIRDEEGPAKGWSASAKSRAV